MKYLELKDEQPVLNEVFFAFSNEQFAEGLKKWNLQKEQIRTIGAGCYGTSTGLKQMMAFYDEMAKRIGEQCTPQEVYEYEFDNHECDYVGNDAEAMRIVLSYFSIERAKEVKRKWGYCPIEQLNNEE